MYNLCDAIVSETNEVNPDLSDRIAEINALSKLDTSRVHSSTPYSSSPDKLICFGVWIFPLFIAR